jgi:hypothetical protein
MIKLPEPEGRICFDGGDWEEDFVSSQDAYSEEQMLQFRRDALEEAIERITALREDWGDVAEESGMSTAISEIRKLKDET